MEDQCLRCNNRLPSGAICRNELKNVAIVTTCSHVLCQRCAESTGFTGTDGNQRRCPVCEQSLPNFDDAAEMNLCPTEEYKTSVLCGLDPTTVMECASSALSFWNYQMLQETAYQQHLLVALSKKYSGLNNTVQKLVEEANANILQMQEKIDEISQEKTDIHQKNIRLAETCRERGKKYSELRKAYDVLKKMVQQTHQDPITEEVAEQAVRHFVANPELEALRDVKPNKPSQHVPGHVQQRHKLYTINNQGDIEHIHRHQHRGSSSSHHGDENSRMPPPIRPHTIHDQSPRNAPPQNRTPLPGAFRPATDRSEPTSTNRAHTSLSVPPNSAQRYSFKANVHHNANTSRHSSSHGFGGISAGMKVGGASSDHQPRYPPGYVPARVAQTVNPPHGRSVLSASQNFR